MSLDSPRHETINLYLKQPENIPSKGTGRACDDAFKKVTFFRFTNRWETSTTLYPTLGKVSWLTKLRLWSACQTSSSRRTYTWWGQSLSWWSEQIGPTKMFDSRKKILMNFKNTLFLRQIFIRSLCHETMKKKDEIHHNLKSDILRSLYSVDLNTNLVQFLNDNVCLMVKCFKLQMESKM